MFKKIKISVSLVLLVFSLPSLQGELSVLAYAPGDVYYTGKGSETDEDLRTKVVTKITTGWFERGFENITVSVKNGRVTLKGSVKTKEDKKRVEEAVIGTNGVETLDSQLMIEKTK